jgi:hypothetical protein
MKKLLQRGLYLMKAKGRHGTHSPFVYAFVEEVLRDKTKFALPNQYTGFSNKEISLLGRALLHLQPTIVYVDDNLKSLLINLKISNPSLHFEIDTLQVNDKIYKNEGLFLCFPTTENGTFLSNQFKSQSHAAIILHQQKDMAAVSNREALYQDKNIKMVMELWSFSYLSNHSDFKMKQFFRLR